MGGLELLHALSLIERAIAVADASDPAQLDAMVSAYNTEVMLLTRSGHLDAALAAAEESLARLGPASDTHAFERANALNALAVALMDSGAFKPAARINRDVLRLLGDGQSADDIQARTITLTMLGTCERNLAHYDAAAEDLGHAIDLSRGRTGLRFQHAYVLRALGKLAIDRERFGEAIGYLLRSLDETRRVWGERHPNTLGPLLLLSRAEVGSREFTSAAAHLDLARTIAKAHLRPTDPNFAMMLYYQSCLEHARGDRALALETLSSAIARGEESMGAAHPNVLRFKVHRASLLIEQGRNARALRLLEGIQQPVRASFPKSTPVRDLFERPRKRARSRLRERGVASIKISMDGGPSGLAATNEDCFDDQCSMAFNALVDAKAACPAMPTGSPTTV